MKILVADKFEAWGLDQLKSLAGQVECQPALAGTELNERLRSFDPDILIVRSTKVPADAVNAGKRIRGIIRAGAGVDNIDVQAASARGIMVANCPGMNSAAVAELTIGLMISLDRKIPDNVADLRAGKWNKKKYAAAALGLKDKTLGIIGAGGIGTRVAKAALALDMKVLYYHLGRQLRLVDYRESERAELDELLRRSDIVSLHVPGGGSTHHLIDAEKLALMKPDALLINTARAGVVDEKAVAAALQAGKLRGAALDVFPDEPGAGDPEFNTPLAQVPNLYGTHHIGASTQQAQLAVAAEAVRLVAEYKNSGVLPNCVNKRGPSATCLLVIRMKNRPGSLAHVFQVISDAGINAEEMDHVIYDGGQAACAHIRIDRAPDEQACERLRHGHDNMLGVEVVQID